MSQSRVEIALSYAVSADVVKTFIYRPDHNVCVMFERWQKPNFFCSEVDVYRRSTSLSFQNEQDQKRFEDSLLRRDVESAHEVIKSLPNRDRYDANKKAKKFFKNFMNNNSQFATKIVVRRTAYGFSLPTDPFEITKTSMKK